MSALSPKRRHSRDGGGADGWSGPLRASVVLSHEDDSPYLHAIAHPYWPWKDVDPSRLHLPQRRKIEYNRNVIGKQCAKRDEGWTEVEQKEETDESGANHLKRCRPATPPQPERYAVARKLADCGTSGLGYHRCDGAVALHNQPPRLRDIFTNRLYSPTLPLPAAHLE